MWSKLIVISAAALLVLGVAACSDDDDDGTDATPTASVCDPDIVRRNWVAMREVGQSVKFLTSGEVLSFGPDETDGLKAAVDQVRRDIEDLKETVSADIEAEVEALETAVSDADDTLASIGGDVTLSEKFADVDAALMGIAAAAADLKDALDTECP